MYVIDNIVYAEKKDLLKIISIEALPDFLLRIEFSTGEIKIFDFKSLLSFPAFLPLQEKAVFNAVALERGYPIWLGGEIDIAPEYLYENGTVA